jgi:Contractile injection system tube protein/LysM domain
MAELVKLKIMVEKAGAYLQFETSSRLDAMFNPDKLVFSKSVGWQKQNASERDVPELQFTNAEPRSLNLDLFFDTYDSPAANKNPVTKFTDKLHHLTTVEKHGNKHRPPVLRLLWGNGWGNELFQGVLERLEQQFTMFMEDGTPVRATCRCTFKEWRTNKADQQKQNTQSADVAKIWVAKHGDSLSGIAWMEYSDASLWRPIAEANHLDNPRNLVPGTRLLVPTLTQRNGSS